MVDPSMSNFLSQSQPSVANPANTSTTSSPRRFTCPHCSRIFDSPQAYSGHQNAHKRKRAAAQFTCPHCPRIFYSSQALSGHQNAHKRKRAAAQFTYPHCSRIFYSSQALSGHQNAHKRKRAAAQFSAVGQNRRPQTSSNVPLFLISPQINSNNTPHRCHFPTLRAWTNPQVQQCPLRSGWNLEPFQPQPPQSQQHQHLPPGSVPQSFLGVSTPDSLSTTNDVDLTLRL